MIIFLIACQNQEYVERVYTTPPEEPSEYSVDKDWPDQSAEFDLVSIEDDINEVLPQLRNYNADPVVSSYFDVMSYADPYCPASYVDNGNAFWYGECESSGGMTYNGYLFYNTYSEMDFFEDGGVWDVTVVSGVTDMIYPSTENRVHWGGDAYLAEGVSFDGYPVYFSLLNGSFWDQNQEGWLSEGYNSNLMLYGMRFEFEELSATALYVQGSLNLDGNSFGELSSISAVNFNELLTYPELIGFPCEIEPLGILSVRTKDGNWLDITFDVETDWEMSGECDGCGTAYHNGEEIGEICIDNSSLIDWEERPWSTSY